MEHYITALTIAGSDPSGGAGMEADMKTMSALGVYATAAITAITVQNTLGVTESFPVPPHIIRGQIEAVIDDIHPAAVKIGMLGDRDTSLAVADALDGVRLPIVLDPVMISTSGHSLANEEAVEIMRQRLIPKAALVTPNLPEAAVLAEMEIHSPADMKEAAERILRNGAKAVLVKGGHARGSVKRDLLLTRDGECRTYESSTVDTRNTHGTGCTLSSAIAAGLAMHMTLEAAVQMGKDYVQRALQAGADVLVGGGHGPVNHFFAPLPLRKEKVEEHIRTCQA